MISNIKNIVVASEILILHHNKIIQEAGKPPKLELKKIKSDKKRQFKKNLKKYLEE